MTLQVVSSGNILLPVPAPSGDWSNAANVGVSDFAFAGSSNYAYLLFYFSNTVFNPINAYWIRVDRSHNTASYQTLYAGAADEFWQPQIIRLSANGTHAFTFTNHRTPDGARHALFQKRSLTDGSLVSEVEVSSVGQVLGANDMDVATIGGVEYCVITLTDPFTNIRYLKVLNTSSMTVAVSKTYDPGHSTAMPFIPCAFDAAGNAWYAPLMWEGTPMFIRKVAVPSGTETEYTFSGDMANTSVAQLSFNAAGQMVITGGEAGGAGGNSLFTFDVSGGAPAQIKQVAVTPIQFDGINTLLPSPRFANGSTYFFSGPLGQIAKSDLSAVLDIGPIQTVNVGPIGNGNLDDSTSNPHRSGTIDATMWAVGGTTIGGANFDAIKWFNLNVSCKVTWVAQYPLGNLPDDSQFLRFRLRGFSGSIPRVIATDVVVETQFDAPASAGQTTITQNSDINPAGTFWTIEFHSHGKTTSQGNFRLSCGSDLTSVQPI